jgi:hypothetical protein
MKSRFLESRTGGSHLEMYRHGRAISRDGNPRDREQQEKEETELLTAHRSRAI